MARYFAQDDTPDDILRAGGPFKQILESSRMGADDRLSSGPFGSLEGGNGIVEGSHFADVGA